MERWRTIPDFPKYDLSNEGRIYNEETRRVLKPSSMQQQLIIRLERDGLWFTRSVPRLVAKSWVENTFSRIFDTVMHLDGDRHNCVAKNLVWRPRWFVIEYHRQFSYPPILWGGRPIMLVESGEVYETAREFSVKYGILEKDILYHLQTIGGRQVPPYNFTFRQV